jgi:hypothetical protein
MKETLRDTNGRVRGYLMADGYKIRLRDPNMNLLGWYCKSTDTTRDSSSNKIGNGNMLGMLMGNL